MDNKVIYTIGQVCEKLNVENFNLRYIEKALELDIKRNEFGERVYTEQNLNDLKLAIELRGQGLNYKAIKKVLDHQEEVVADIVTDPAESEEGLIVSDDRLTQLISMIKESVEESIEIKVNTRLDSIINKVDSLEKQNQELKQALEKEQERHFRELDEKLTRKWREEEERRNLPWYKKMFKKD